MREKFLLNNSSGSALLIVLLVLIALSILGFACIHSGIIELKISSNERQMKENFYLAESAAMEGVQRLAAMPSDDLNEREAFWHHSPGAGAIDFRNPEKWVYRGDHEHSNCMAAGFHTDTFIAAVEWRVAAGSSLVMTETRLYQNRIYGLCRRHGADSLVEIGINRRY
jgi:hypothetical protein